MFSVCRSRCCYLFAGVVAIYVHSIVPVLYGPLGTKPSRERVVLLCCCLCVSVRVVTCWFGAYKKVLPEDGAISAETRRRKGDKQYMYFIVRGLEL